MTTWLNLTLLRLGLPIWNQWRSLSKTVNDLSGANLAGANFGEANLASINLSYANLCEAYFRGADLSNANLSYANLSKANLRGVNLYKTNLNGANLSQANLAEANLSYANLTQANLTAANLSKAQFLETVLSKAILTASCLQSWNLVNTEIDDVICEYFYDKENRQERRPREGFFKPKEFSILLQKTLSTIDLVFLDGISWEAFLLSFQEIRAKYGDEDISIQAIERKRYGNFIIRLEVTNNVDQVDIERSLREKYENKLKFQEEMLTEQRNYLTNLMGVVRIMAEKETSRTINIGVGNFIESNTGIYVEGNHISISQDLSHAASQIQDLLEQLQKQGMTTDVAEEQVATSMANQAQNNPTMRENLIKWGQSLGDATVSDVVKGVVKLAIRSAGIPLP